MFKRIIQAFTFWLLVTPILALAWTHGQAAVNFIQGFSGSFLLGGGLNTNEVFTGTEPTISWASYRPLTSNVLFQSTGSMNALRNGSMTSWQHTKYMTQDAPATNPYHLGVASFTASVSGTTMTVTGSPTGTLAPFQRVTDAQNFTTNGATAVSGTVLNFASTTGIAAGMYVTDLTNVRAIAGNITVVSTTGTTVTLSHPVGFTGNNQTIGAPGVGSGDVVAFSTVLRGTYIVQQLTGSAGVAGTYQLNISQTVSSETMQSAGGWAAEGVYVIPVGAAGTSNYVECVGIGGVFNGSTFAPSTMECGVVGSLDDIIIRFPIDYVDASRFQCGVYTGAPRNCISSNNLIQPVTFQINITYSSNVHTAPSLTTKNPCPLIAISQAGANNCLDNWTTSSYDLASITMPACDSMSPTPITCDYGYTWTPTGIVGGYQVEYHTNAFTNGQFFILGGFELKQTPGATCLGSAPPCFQYVNGPIEIPDAVVDIQRNMRFAQLIGSGWGAGWNAANTGPTESTAGFALSTTTFVATWPLPVSLRCDYWNTGQKSSPTCRVPNVYFQNVGDYKFFVAGPTEFSATALVTNKIGLNSIQIIATSSGMTAGTAGFVHWGSGNGDMILIDSAVIGD